MKEVKVILISVLIMLGIKVVINILFFEHRIAWLVFSPYDMEFYFPIIAFLGALFLILRGIDRLGK